MLVAQKFCKQRPYLFDSNSSVLCAVLKFGTRVVSGVRNSKITIKKMKETNGLRINVKSIQIWTTNSLTGPPVIKTSISEEVVFRKRNYS